MLIASSLLPFLLLRNYLQGVIFTGFLYTKLKQAIMSSMSSMDALCLIVNGPIMIGNLRFAVYFLLEKCNSSK